MRGTCAARQRPTDGTTDGNGRRAEGRVVKGRREGDAEGVRGGVGEECDVHTRTQTRARGENLINLMSGGGGGGGGRKVDAAEGRVVKLTSSLILLTPARARGGFGEPQAGGKMKGKQFKSLTLPRRTPVRPRGVSRGGVSPGEFHYSRRAPKKPRNVARVTLGRTDGLDGTGP